MSKEAPFRIVAVIARHDRDVGADRAEPADPELRDLRLQNLRPAIGMVTDLPAKFLDLPGEMQAGQQWKPW